MDTNEFECLMGSLESGDSGYMCYDCKDGMLFLESRTGYQCLLVDKKNGDVVDWWIRKAIWWRLLRRM